MSLYLIIIRNVYLNLKKQLKYVFYNAIACTLEFKKEKNNY